MEIVTYLGFIWGLYERLYLAIPEWFKESLSLLANVVAIVSFVGVIYAVIDYFNKRRDSRRQVLFALKGALEVIATWTSFDAGGYSKSDLAAVLKENEKVWANPYAEVFAIDTSALSSIWLNPGLAGLADDVVQRLAAFNQEVLNFNSQLASINAFRFGLDSDMAIKIHLSLNGQIESKLTREEKFASLKLREMYAGLHFDAIGDDSSGRLYQKHKELVQALRVHL